MDGLRAVAVSLVVADHARPWFVGGRVGVQMFFVLSGFLITSLLTEELKRFRTISRGRFYGRRLLRLYPALLLMLVVTLPLTRQFVGALAAATYTSNLVVFSKTINIQPYGPCWSLALEEQFYLLWPLCLPLLLALPRRRAVAVVLGAAVVSVACAQIGLHSVLGRGETLGRLWYNPLFQANGLLVGCALALALGGARPVTKRPAALVGAGLALCLGVALIESVAGVELVAIWNFVAALGTVILIVGLVQSRAGIAALFTWRPVVWLGRRSYAIYLWNYTLLSYAFADHWRAPILVLVILAILVAAELSWRLVEAPLQKFKRRLTPLEAAPVASAAPAILLGSAEG